MDMLRALGTFIRILETGSFSAVARESNSTPSAVTRLVGQLEEHFGVRLFHRTTRHLSLTEDGQNLLTHSHDVIDAAAGRAGVALTAGGVRLVTPGLGDLLDRYPGLTVDLVIREHFDDLIEDRLDLAVRVGQPVDASLVARSVGGFGRTLVAAPAYLETR